MKKIIISLFSVLLAFNVYANDEFPGREIYPQVPYIEIDDLYQQRNNVVMIDARSQYEYETLRIAGAEHVSLALSSKLFEKKIRALRDLYPGKKLVFYCNGHKCMKSYKAARRSLVYLGLDNVFAFDAGIFDWATKYPMETLLIDDVLADASKLISKDKFNRHILDAEKFIKSATPSTAVLDIRDRVDRDGFYIFSGYEKSISLSLNDRSSLDQYLSYVKKNKKPLYIYDMVGKQVRWLQYYIEAKGIREYYFMKGGAQAFFQIPINKLMDS